MKIFKTIQTIAFCAIFCQQSHSLAREKRSLFSWPFFLGGSGSAAVPASEEPVAIDADIQVPPQQVEIPFQQLSPGYHYPIWRVHKYNGIQLKPIPISLVPQQYQQFYAQQLHTQVPRVPQVPQVQIPQDQRNGQQVSNSCKPKSASPPIPPELQDLADQFGIKDVSKLPSLDDAMGLLGTTSRAETIQTIKELAATRDGMNLIRQFLASEDGAAVSGEPNSNEQCVDSTIPTQPQQPNNVNMQHRPMPHQQYGVPYPPKQHEQYGLPNTHRANAFHGVESPSNEYLPPSTHVKSEAVVPHEEYGVPKAPNSEQVSQHEIYGLPNLQAASFQQGYYPPRSNIDDSAKSDAIVPHQEYNVPNEATSSDHETPTPHQEYGVPNELSTAHSEHQGYNIPNSEHVPHEIYGLPNLQAASFQQGYYPPRSNIVESANSDPIVPHQEYNVPNEATSSDHETHVPHQEYGVPKDHAAAFAQHQEYNKPKPNIEELQSDQSVQLHPTQHEMYGLPTVNQPVTFHQNGAGYYPPESDNFESEKSEAIVPHMDYGVPNVDTKSDHQTQVPHEVYGVPSESLSQPQQVYSIPEQQTLDEHAAVSSEYGVPHEPHQAYGAPNHDSSNQHIDNVEQDIRQVPHHEYSTPQNNVPHGLYELPHQRFFETPNVYRQPQYGAPTQTNLNNVRTGIPILRQIDGTLDRTNTNLQLAQLLTTTVRPEAGFFERIGAWTKYLAPPGPTIPIVPPQVTEDVNEPVNTHSGGHFQNAYTIPVPKIPDLNEQHPLPATPQLPNMYIPQKFIMPSAWNQGPFVRGHSFANEYSLPSQQPAPFDGQSVEQFVPDVSQLPLDQRILSNDPRTSYGTPAHQHSYADDSSLAASENDEQHVAVTLPKRSGKFGNRIDNESFDENEVAVDQRKTKNGPQRISSYDSYATGKLNRADDDAILQLIPTQKPSLYSKQARRLEDSSIIDAIATMTSGFRPIA